MRAALVELREDWSEDLTEAELKALLLRAFRSDGGSRAPQSNTDTSLTQLLGLLAARVANTLPFSQVQRAVSVLDPGVVVGAMRRGLGVARGFLNSFNPKHIAEVDEFGYDEEFTRHVRPLMDFMFDTYWRVEVRGGDYVPRKGRALLVANHSGVVPWDAAMLVTAVHRVTDGERHLRCLMLDLFATMPFLGATFMKLGQIRACPENGMQLLERDHLVGVFPEGLKGIGKLYSQRYKLQRFGRAGYVKLAIRARSHIIPVAIVGGEEIYPLFYRADWLARLFNFPYFPVTLTFPWLGLLGVIPLPSKWHIEFGEPFSLERYGPDDAEDDVLVNDLSDRIKSDIQEMIYAGLKRRRNVFLG